MVARPINLTHMHAHPRMTGDCLVTPRQPSLHWLGAFEGTPNWRPRRLVSAAISVADCWGSWRDRGCLRWWQSFGSGHNQVRDNKWYPTVEEIGRMRPTGTIWWPSLVETPKPLWASPEELTTSTLTPPCRSERLNSESPLWWVDNDPCSDIEPGCPDWESGEYHHNTRC